MNKYYEDRLVIEQISARFIPSDNKYLNVFVC